MCLCRIVLIVAGLSLVLPLPAAKPQAGEHVPPGLGHDANLVSQSMGLGVVSGRVVTTIPWRFGTGTHTSNVNKERITFKGLPGGPSSLCVRGDHPAGALQHGHKRRGKVYFPPRETTATFTPVEFTQTPNAPAGAGGGRGRAERIPRQDVVAPLDRPAGRMSPLYGAGAGTVRPKRLSPNGGEHRESTAANRQRGQAAGTKALERVGREDPGNDRFTGGEAADRDLRPPSARRCCPSSNNWTCAISTRDNSSACAASWCP